MSKDLRFRKDEREDQEYQDMLAAKKNVAAHFKQTKANLARKKRDSKRMAQARSKSMDH